MKKPIIGYYGYWVFLTYLSIAAAGLGIYFAYDGSVRNAILCMIASGICDTFDGRLASTAKRNERQLNFGMQIDAMADLLSFGVLPAAILYAQAMADGSLSLANAFIGVMIALAALIRLSYFNAVEMEMHTKQEKRTYFEGLPTTIVAVIIPITYAICNILEKAFLPVYNILLIVISVLFVLRFKIAKPGIRTQIIICIVGIPIIIYILFIGV
ncbi:MAG: CDP-alcohol phosphatidyltransferase family protein [Lachnospiraceae bacterium]|nr:CDP-alcohol phosphatidyltransferase family protein [Lachnospiraceae bacterium]